MAWQRRRLLMFLLSVRLNLYLCYSLPRPLFPCSSFGVGNTPLLALYSKLWLGRTDMYMCIWSDPKASKSNSTHSHSSLLPSIEMPPYSIKYKIYWTILQFRLWMGIRDMRFSFHCKVHMIGFDCEITSFSLLQFAVVSELNQGEWTNGVRWQNFPHTLFNTLYSTSQDYLHSCLCYYNVCT